MINKTIKSKRLDVYEALVDNNDRLPFESRYELFSFAATIGFLRGEQYRSDVSYSQDFIDTDDISASEHQSAINLIYNLTALEIVNEEDTDIDSVPSIAWNRVLQYADQGVSQLREDFDSQEDVDLIRYLNEAENKWPERIKYIDEMF